MSMNHAKIYTGSKVVNADRAEYVRALQSCSIVGVTVMVSAITFGVMYVPLRCVMNALSFELEINASCSLGGIVPGDGFMGCWTSAAYFSNSPDFVMYDGASAAVFPVGYGEHDTLTYTNVVAWAFNSGNYKDPTRPLVEIETPEGKKYVYHTYQYVAIATEVASYMSTDKNIALPRFGMAIGFDVLKNAHCESKTLACTIPCQARNFK